jgi:hypothetical protein
MTIAKNIAAKATVAAVAAAMALSAFVVPASAQQSADELQQMINDLLLQVAALQSDLGQGATSVASGVCPYTWTRDLSQGSTGGDVMKLQQFLNADLDTRVAATGAGSVGMETEYYGPATAAAVSKMQVKYRADILSPANLVNPTGYFGPSSRAKANSLCVAAPVVPEPPVDPVDPVDPEQPEEPEPAELSGEASVNDVKVDDADDDTIQEGDEDVEIGMLTLTFQDGDAEVSRIDISLVGDNNNDEKDPWDTFDTVSLWVDGDKIAEESADRRSDYLNDNDGSIRFTGLDFVAMEDEDVKITVAASVQTGMDNGDGEEWTLSIDGFRFFDADGVASTEDVTGYTTDTATFTIEEAGYDDEIIVKTSSNDPDADTFQVKDNSNSGWYTVFVFDLDTKDSTNDITLNEVPVTVVVSSSTFDAIVDDYELVIDGVTIDKLADNNGATTGDYTDGATVVLTFDVNQDVVIDAGDRVEAELRLKFNSLANGDEGTTVTGKVTSANADAIDAEGGNDLGTDQLSGSATGDPQTLRTEGFVLDLTSINEDKDLASFSGDTDTGTYTFKFEVTAFGDDFYFDDDVAIVDYDLLVDGATTSAASSSPLLDISGAANASVADFVLTDGETATFTFSVETASSVSGAVKVRINSVAYSAADDSTEELSANALPTDDWTSNSLNLNN